MVRLPAYRPILKRDDVGWEQQFLATVATFEQTSEAMTLHIGDLLDDRWVVHYLRLEIDRSRSPVAMQVELNDQGNQRSAADVEAIELGPRHLRIHFLRGPFSGRVSYSPEAEILQDEPWGTVELTSVVIWLDNIADQIPNIRSMLEIVAQDADADLPAVISSDAVLDRATVASSSDPSRAPSIRRHKTAAEIAATTAKLVIGAVLDGIVAGLTEYGAFIDLGGVTGMVHCTELPAAPSAAICVGQPIRVKVIKLASDGFPWLSPAEVVHQRCDCK